MNPPVTYSLTDGIASIILDDGKANVMSVAMLDGIQAALARAEADKAVVVIQGRPGMFSGGFDLSVFKRDQQELFRMLKAGAELTERLLTFLYPVIAVCTGPAIAMGAFLLLCADYRIGTHPEAKIQVNEVQIGLTLPHFAIEVCRQRLTPAHLCLAAITAHSYDQQSSVSAGFLDEVVTLESLAQVLNRRTGHLQKLNMEAFAATKLRLRSAGVTALRTAIAADIDGWSKRFNSEA